MTFSEDKKFLPEKQLVWCTVYKICMLCVFRCADTILFWKWLKMAAVELRNEFAVWNEGLVSQENLVKLSVI